MDDRPFIVDSILEFFHKHEISVRLLLHPVFHVTRANDGSIVSFEQATAGERPESFTHAEIELPGALRRAKAKSAIAYLLDSSKILQP